MKLELAPATTAPCTIQKTLDAWAPFARTTLLAAAVESARSIWKMKISGRVTLGVEGDAPGEHNRGGCAGGHRCGR